LIDWLTGLLIYAEIDNHGTVVSVRYNAISCGCFENTFETTTTPTDQKRH